MIRAILFDVDNTLIDFLLMKEIAVDAAVRAMQDLVDISFDDAKENIYKIYDNGKMEHETVFQEFLKELGYEEDYRIISKAVVAYRRAKLGHTIPYPQVKETLLKLKASGLILGVVTDAPRKNAWIRLTELGLEDFFDFVITYDDTGIGKKSSKPFDLAKSKLPDIRPEDILFVGDSIHGDMPGARFAGFKTVFAAYGYNEGMIRNRIEEQKLNEIINLVKPNYIAYKFSDILEFI